MTVGTQENTSVNNSGRSLMKYLFNRFYTIAAECANNLPENNRPEVLHDLRVALRRLRRALTVFRKGLDDEPLRKRCIKAIRQFSHDAGRYRDHDVWLMTIRQFGQDPQVEHDTGWQRFRETAESISVHELQHEEHLSGSYDTLLSVLCSLPGIGSAEPAAPSGRDIRSFAKKQVNRSAKKVRASLGDYRTWTAEELHRFRRVCRNARYVCEFFAPQLPKAVDRWAGRFREIADNLGTIHDIDVSLAEPFGISLPPVYRDHLMECRKSKMKRMKEHARWIRALKNRVV